MWFKIENSGIKLYVLVKPNAKKTAIIGVVDQELQISVHARAQEGEANKALINYLAKLLKIPKTKIILERGQESRHKQISMPLTAMTESFIDNPDKYFTSRNRDN